MKNLNNGTKLTFKNFNLINQTKLVEQNFTQLLHVEINLAFIKIKL